MTKARFWRGMSWFVASIICGAIADHCTHGSFAEQVFYEMTGVCIWIMVDR